jgi:glycerol-3-phosphate O-acyltransferase/dihydroxyacetone phosphate acyltransferase
LVQAARRLYRPAHRKLHISQVVDLNRRFLIGYNMYKQEPQIVELKERILAYNQLLKYHGIKDHQVQKTGMTGRATLLRVVKKFFIMIFLMSLDFPG